jgi:ADP-ribose pyrophosphatase YjhB (NUDIX family)
MNTSQKISLSVDAVVEKNGKILLIRRKKGPFANSFSLPGGKVEPREKVEDALKREIFEETNLKIKPVEILGVYSDPKRDPKKHKVSITFVARLTGSKAKAKAKDDAKSIEWLEVIEKRSLAFDHNKVLNDYRK